MFKRVIWLGAGYAAGLGTSYWAYRKVQRTVQRYAPVEVASRTRDSARDLGRNVRAAMAEGRDAMRAREVELRSDLDERRN